MTNKDTNKEMDMAKVAGAVGGVLAAAAAAGGAAYYFWGTKHAKQNRKQVAGWAHDLKTDVVRRAKQMKKIDEKALHAIVDQATMAYENMQSIDKSDLLAVANELKGGLKHIEREMSGAAKKGKSAAKKSVKKVTKVAKKNVKKATRIAKKSVKRIVRKAKKAVGGKKKKKA